MADFEVITDRGVISVDGTARVEAMVTGTRVRKKSQKQHTSGGPSRQWSHVSANMPATTSSGVARPRSSAAREDPRHRQS